MWQSRRVALIGSALIVLFGCPTSGAGASTVRMQPDEAVGRALTISSAPGETDDVMVSYDYDTTFYTVTDANGATAQTGCDQVDDITVTCRAESGGLYTTRIVADLDDGDDSFAIGETGAFYGASVDGGAGADTITGGNRPDLLAGGPGDDVISGGGEADVVLGDEGDDTLSGGAGDDEIDGSAGSDAVDAGADNDLVNLREEPDGRSGTADPPATCGSGGDRVALDVADAAPAGDCEFHAPRFAGVPILVAPEAVAGRSLSLDLAPIGVTGSPAPELAIVWLSCTEDECEEVAFDVDRYTLQPSDVGRFVGAAVIATNGPPQLGPYADAVEVTDLAGPVRTAAPPAGGLLVPQAPLAPAPPRVAPPTGAQREAGRTALAQRAMGAAVAKLRETAGLVLYRRAATGSLTVRGARRTKILAAVCEAPSCRVSVRSRLRLRTRRGGRTHTRHISLPAAHRTLRAGEAAGFDVRLGAASRRAVRRARSAALRVSFEIRTSAGPTRDVVWFPLRLR